MESLDISAQAVEEANRKIGQFIDKLRPGQASFPPALEEMTAVLAEIVHVGESMRDDQAQNAEGHLAEALTLYRSHLQQLQDLLPGLHARLLTERARLEAERAHVDAASAWARSVNPRNL